MNQRFAIKLVAACAILAGATAPFGIAHAQTKLKWAHVYETSEPYHKWSVWAADEFKKRTNGKYEIQVFPASSLGKESDINQGLQLGTVDIILTGASFASNSYPRLAVSYYPFTFRDADHVVKYGQSEVFKELTEGYKKATGNTVTALTYYGARHATSNKLFKNCDEMKGLKIRVPDSPAYTALPRACGANPTPIAFAEVYLALQNGTVDAQENPLPTIDAKKFYEVQKYITLTGHILESLVTIVASPAWSKMNDADKKTFDAVLWEASNRASQDIVDAENKLVAEFEKRGKTVNKVDRAPFAAAVRGPLTAADAPWPRELFDRIQAIK